MVKLLNVGTLQVIQKAACSFLPRDIMRINKIPPNFKDVQIPETRLLPMMEKVPNLPDNNRVLKLPKNYANTIRGPEPIHNRLLYKQYGLITLSGGLLKPQHLNQMRNIINKKINPENMFAIWRVDAPWKPAYYRGKGKKMGGGKPAPDHYTTPVKTGRIILELGGKIEFEEATKILEGLVQLLPMPVMVVSKQILDDLEKEYEAMKKKNCNPVSLQYLIDNNMTNCQHEFSVYDQKWYGKYI